MQDNERLGYLDSMRGVAACLVLLNHCWLANTTGIERLQGSFLASLAVFSDFLSYAAGKFLESSRFAIIVFFVLSGFVLAYSAHRKPASYGGFVIRRFFRIYPAFLFVILSSYILHLFIGVQHAANSVWLIQVVNPDLSATALAKHLFMWGSKSGMDLDNAMWTLVHEMRISLIFPFILVTVIRYGWRSVFAYWLLSMACNAWLLSITGAVTLNHSFETEAQSFAATGYYIVFFAAGAYLAVMRAEAARHIARLPQWTKILLLALSVWCLPAVYINHSIIAFTIDYTLGLGALGLIALALGYKRFADMLSHGVLVGLGRISYSLYLVHIPILYVVTQTVGKSWNGIQITVAVILLSLVSAEIISKAIEFPSIRLGKKLSARFERRVLRQISQTR